MRKSAIALGLAGALGLLSAGSAEAQLEEVAHKMAEHKFGSVVVMENNRIVGMFTTVDGMRALADVLNRRAHS